MNKRCEICGETKKILAKNKCKRCYDRLNYRERVGSTGRKPKDVHQKRRWSLKVKYNLTLEDYNKMYKQQNGCCQICGKHEEILDVDHNHQTGEVRALLCRACNTLTGQVENRGDLINKIIKYLGEYNV